MIDYLEKNKKFAIIFTVLIAIEIFLVSSIPGKRFVTGGIDVALIYHLMIFFLLNFFFILSMVGKKKIKIGYILISLVFSVSYAVLDEIHQFFVPLRLPSVTDVLVDSMGIFLSTIIYMYYKRSSIPRKSR